MLISLCYFGVQYYVHFFSVSCSNLISSYCHHTLFITVGTTNYLITESEVVTRKSQTEALPY